MTVLLESLAEYFNLPYIEESGSGVRAMVHHYPHDVQGGGASNSLITQNPLTHKPVSCAA